MTDTTTIRCPHRSPILRRRCTGDAVAAPLNVPAAEPWTIVLCTNDHRLVIRTNQIPELTP